MKKILAMIISAIIASSTTNNTINTVDGEFYNTLEARNYWGEDVVLYTFTGNNPEYFIVKNYDVFQDGIWKEENEDFFYGSSISNSGEIYPIDITLVAIGEYNGDNEVIKKVKNAKLTERQEVYSSSSFGKVQ